MLLLQRAAELNRRQEQLDLAQAVALGIAEAFNPQAQVLAKLRRTLLDPRPEGEPDEPDPQVIASLFGAPLLE